MAAAPESPRVTPQRLLETLSRQCTSRDAGRTALLVVALNRSDRLLALAQDDSNRYVLAEIARRVQSMLRPGDRYAFVANDELWLMLAQMPDESFGVLGARTLRESMLHPIHVSRADGSRSTVQLNPIVGGAWTTRRTQGEPMSMVRAASDACERARTLEGRLHVVRLDDTATWSRRNELERELRAALFANQLDVHFQPQIELASRRCVAAEALIRWTRADGSAVSPSLIASLCEERGMMGQLTQYVLNTALRNQRQWAMHGIDVSVSINLSAATLANQTFPMLVAHALSTWRVPGDRLTLELTEAAILRNEHAALDLMKQLRELGCQLALDDFGTGYSSFAWLRRFPLNELKIDHSFVGELDGDGDGDGRGDDSSVRALIELAHAFRIRALAEGVESAGAQQALSGAGCDRAQGFRFSPGLPPHAFVEWCRRNHEDVLLNDNEAAVIQ